MSLLKPFYRYTRQLFEIIRAEELRKGDELALASQTSRHVYGAVELMHVINSGGEWMVVRYILPHGASLKSSQDTEIYVDGDKGICTVTQYIDPCKEVMVLA